MNKLTIGYILDDTLDVADGVQQAVLQIGEEMRARGHDVHYITTTTKRTDLNNVHDIGNSVAVKFNGNSVRTPYPQTNKKIDELFHDYAFDVLHVQMPYSPLFAAKVIKRAPKDVVIVGTFHILPYSLFAKVGTKLLGRALSTSLKRIQKAYAVSEPAKKFMYECFSLKGDVLGNPVDFYFYSSHNTEKKSDNISIVYVGRFDERKGVKQLIKALEIVELSSDKKVNVTMCGKGPLLDKVKDIAKDKSLPVIFPGFVDDNQKAQFLASADIAVFPSTSGESFGIVLTEAMSSGAGITIGGNNPGYSSVLYHWPEALFDARKPETIAKKLLQFINNPDLRKQIGDEQHKAVVEFDTKHIASTLLDDYNALLAKTVKNHHN